MNNLLKVKLTFQHDKNRAGGGARNLNKTRSTSSTLIEKLINDLKRVKSFFDKNPFIKEILIDAYYNDIIAKSGRIQNLLKITGDCSDYIVGARFTDVSNGNENHIITYYVSRQVIDAAIGKLEDAKLLIDEQLGGIATSTNFDSSDKSIIYSKYKTPKTYLRDVIIDCSALEKFDVPNAVSDINKEQIIVTFYQTEAKLDELLFNLGITQDKYFFSYAGKNTLSVSKDVYKILLDNIPYMISMATSDISEIVPEQINKIANQSPTIPSPKNEPTIGVIDTMFDSNSYFCEWVDYREELNFYEKNSLREEHYNHGTAVSSIIVDGPALNPWLDDG